MAIKATGQITIVDLSDSSQLSVYLIANLPKTQILDLSTGTANPDWAQENLEITPNILLNQANIPLTDTNLTVTYKRKDGSGAESSLVTGETVTNKVLKVNKNILESSDAKSITYICYVSYLDTKLNLTVSAQADINFSLVTNGTEGVGVNEIKEYYYSSTSATELVGGEWSETYPGWESGKYIWTKTIIAYTDNTTKETTPICVSGADGKDGENGKDGTDGINGTSVTVSSTETTYQKSSSPTTIPTGTWSPTVVATDTTNKYLWTKVVVTFSDGKTATSYSVSSTMDSIAVGGRNLLLDSRHIQLYSSNNNSYPITSTKMIENDKEFTRYKRSSTTLSPTLMSLYNAISITNITEYLTNLETTFSFLIRCSHSTTTSLGAYIRTDDNYEFSSNSKAYAIGTEWTRVFVTATITQEYDATSPDVVICFCPYNITIPSGQIDNFYIDICEWKIEKGNIATDWTPAPEDMATEYQLQAEAKTLQESINTINQNIRADVEADMQNLKSVIEDDYAAAIDAKATATKKEIDETTGQKVRDLEKYTSELKVNGSSFNYSIEKTKGTNLIKNSVMLQNKQNTSSQTKANFWLNKNLEEDFFTNVTCSDVDSIRAKTDSGSAIIFDYSTDATGLTYDYILSTPIDFKINTDNIMLSYKIKSTISAGTFFAGLVFYKKDTTTTGLGATTAFAQTTGIPTAHYLALNEYDTSSEYADFTQDYVLRTTPFVKSDKKRVTWTCEVSEDNTITLPYEPYLVNGSCEVTLYNLDNTTSTVATTSTTVTLSEEQEWPSAIAVSYDRVISNFAGTTATSITASDFSTVLVNEVLMYYNTSDNKIWVYNPFTGVYVKSANLYNDTDYSEVDSVRVILGVRGASTSTKFKGYVEISDLKVEFDSLSTIWTQHPGETYSKQYTMDEKGFSISSDTNMMFIDEDEIAAYTLDDKGKPNTDDPVFQISGEKTILKKTIVKEDLLIENTTESEDDAFTMKQYYVNGQWFFLFY